MEDDSAPQFEYDPVGHSKVTEASLAIGGLILGGAGIESIVDNYSRGTGISMVVTGLVMLFASRAARFGREHSDYGQQTKEA